MNEERLQEVATFLSLAEPDKSYEQLENYLTNWPDFFQILLHFSLLPDSSKQVKLSALVILNQEFSRFISLHEESEEIIVDSIFSNAVDLFSNDSLQSTLAKFLFNIFNIRPGLQQTIFELLTVLYTNEATVMGALYVIQEFTKFCDITLDDSLIEPLITLVANPAFAQESLHAARNIVKSNQQNFNEPLLEQIFSCYSEYNEKSIEYAAEICAEIYMNDPSQETCCEFLSQALQTTSSTLTYSLLSYLYDESSFLKPNQYLIFALISLMETPNDDPLEDDCCSLSQSIMHEIAAATWEELKPLFEQFFQEIEDDGFKLRALYPVLDISAECSQFISYVQEALNSPFKGDAIADLVPIAKTNIGLINQIIDAAIPFLIDEDIYTRRMAFFSLSNLLSGNFEASPERFDEMIQVFNAYRELIFESEEEEQPQPSADDLQLFSQIIWMIERFVKQSTFTYNGYDELFGEFLNYIQEGNENTLYFYNSLSVVALFLLKIDTFSEEFIPIGQRAFELMETDDETQLLYAVKIIRSLITNFASQMVEVPYFLPMVMTLCTKLKDFQDAESKKLLTTLWKTLKIIILNIGELPGEIYEFVVELVKSEYCTPNYDMSRQMAMALAPLLPNLESEFLVDIYQRSKIMIRVIKEKRPLHHIPIERLIDGIAAVLRERDIDIPPDPMLE